MWVLFGLVVLFNGARHFGNVTVDPLLSAAGDFRDATYFAVRAFVEGVNPYDPDVYLSSYDAVQIFPTYAPQHLWLHAPLAAFSFRAATLVYFFVSAATLVVAVWLADRRICPGSPRWFVPAMSTAVFLSAPGQTNAFGGQTTWELIIGAILFLDGEAPWWQRVIGLVLLAQKPHFAVAAVLYVVVASRRLRVWKVVVPAMAITAVLAAPSIVAAGGVGDFVDSIEANLDHETAVDMTANTGSGAVRIDQLSVAGRLGIPLGGLTTQILVGSLIAVAYGAAGSWLRRRGAHRWMIPIGSLAILTIPPHHEYDGLLLLAPIVALLVMATGRIRQVSLGVIGVLLGVTAIGKVFFDVAGTAQMDLPTRAVSVAVTILVVTAFVIVAAHDTTSTDVAVT